MKTNYKKYVAYGAILGLMFSVSLSVLASANPMLGSPHGCINAAGYHYNCYGQQTCNQSYSSKTPPCVDWDNDCCGSND